MGRPSGSVRRADIFCTVVDNFGDIGVCWRLARGLAHEHGIAVRLWVDDLEVFARLEPALDHQLGLQELEGVEVLRWSEPLPFHEPGDLVIEGFGCALPHPLLLAMESRGPDCVWVNLEYLSAESWIEGVHGRPSYHPRLNLTKYFFCPGFASGSGGLLRERGLLEARTRFQSDPKARAAYWDSVGLPPASPGEKRLALFCYGHAPVAGLVEFLAATRSRWTVVVPEGVAAEAEERARPRGIAVLRVPFQRQGGYDRLLWACDFNAVRGEDSFVRAQWAARPFIWHIYPQESAAHADKLHAYLDRFLSAAPSALAAPVRALFEAWNGLGTTPDWSRLAASLDPLEVPWRGHCQSWCDELGAKPDLATELVQFAEKLLK